MRMRARVRATRRLIARFIILAHSRRMGVVKDARPRAEICIGIVSCISVSRFGHDARVAT